MTADPFVPVGPKTEPFLDPLALSIASVIRDQLWMTSYTSRRSLQVEIGVSEIGGECEKQLAMRGTGVPPVNHPDPLKAMVGTGVHAVLADAYRRLDGGSQRYRVETPVKWKGKPGTCDLLDRRLKVALDWKSAELSRIKEYRRKGPRPRYVTQVQCYAAGLREEGEDVEYVALVFIPVNATLADIYVWVAPVDVELATRAVERYDAVMARALTQGVTAIEKTPTALCPWCPHYLAGSTDSATSCSGGTT